MFEAVVGNTIAALGLAFTFFCALAFPLYFLRLVWASIKLGFAFTDWSQESPVAQRTEQRTSNPQVVGSNPTRRASKPVVDSFSDEFKLPANPFE